ncbi:MAG: glycosyltransferase [Butyrivibrio sp.]|nr:glycosyltransferase [Butyrivibrio sp.]
MVSVIVPIFNAEQSLEKCLTSIQGQTLNDLEIICVNDGSTDGSLDIIREYAVRDNRVVIVDKENGGLVSARKAGLAKASGDYVAFVDSDDWIEPEMYEELLQIAKEYECDVVCGGYFFEGDYISKHVDSVGSGLYKDEGIKTIRELSIMNLKDRGVGIGGSLCTKLFSCKVIKKAYESVFENLTIAEDKVTTLFTMLNAQSVYVVDKAYYHYVKNMGSMVNSGDMDYLMHIQHVWEHFRKAYEHPGFTEQMRIQAEVYLTDILYKGINGRMGFLCKNMLWVDPYWLKEIPDGTHVLLYGFGDFLETYKRQLQHYHNLECEGCVSMPEKAKEAEFDYLVVAIKNKAKADEETDKLVAAGISAEKILWFPQDEVYWKFIEANGWI